MLTIRSILHPTDFSAGAAQALELACALAKEYGARLIVQHVAVPPVVGYGGGLAAPPEGDWKALEDQLHQVKPADAAVHAEHSLGIGDPAAEILRLAQDRKCDLIVMGTHGRTGLARLLMGSVAELVMRGAPCPVLTVRTPGEEK